MTLTTPDRQTGRPARRVRRSRRKPKVPSAPVIDPRQLELPHMERRPWQYRLPFPAGSRDEKRPAGLEGPPQAEAQAEPKEVL